MAKISQNTVTVMNYLKENADKKLTAANVAEALDMSVSTVNGVFTSMSNKGYGIRETVEQKGAVDITFLALTEEGKTADTSSMTENAQAVVEYFKSVDGEKITADDAAEALGMDKRKFTGAFNGLTKKGLAVRSKAKVEGTVKVCYFVLTDEGKAVDLTVSEPDAE